MTLKYSPESVSRISQAFQQQARLRYQHGDVAYEEHQKVADMKALKKATKILK
jgi:hypothetical protein